MNSINSLDSQAQSAMLNEMASVMASNAPFANDYRNLRIVASAYGFLNATSGQALELWDQLCKMQIETASVNEADLAAALIVNEDAQRAITVDGAYAAKMRKSLCEFERQLIAATRKGDVKMIAKRTKDVERTKNILATL